MTSTSAPHRLGVIGQRLLAVFMVVIFVCVIITMVLQPGVTSAQAVEVTPSNSSDLARLDFTKRYSAGENGDPGYRPEPEQAQNIPHSTSLVADYASSLLQDGLMDLVVTTSMTLTAGTYYYREVTVTNNATLWLQGNIASGTGVTISAQNIFVDTGAFVSANGQGYGSGTGPGHVGRLQSVGRRRRARRTRRPKC